MSLERTRVNDGFTAIDGGMDSGSATNLIPRNKYYFGMNATVRNGYPTNRPGWNEKLLVFTDEDTETAYRTGNFQGDEWYLPDDGVPIGLASVSGHIYSMTFSGDSLVVADITPDGDPNMSTLPQVWIQQGDNYMVIQDGVDAPFLFNGSILRRSNIDNDEIPTGTRMAYGFGRIWLARGKNFEAGDIVSASNPNSVITFKEVKRFNDAFSVPITSGDITAMIFSANLDTSLGQGNLQVHTSNGGVVTLLVTTDRASWTTSSIQRIALTAPASLSQDATVLVNGDTWYRSIDGIRSFIVARREFGNWGNTPQSREVNSIMNFDTGDLIQYSSGVWFDNRLLITTSPQKNGVNAYFQGLISLDFDTLSAVANNGFSGNNPSYDGVWSGLNICKINKTMVGKIERCFLFTWNETEGNSVWELSKNDPFDNGDCQISSYIETGSYNFNILTRLKRLIAADLWIDQLKGEVHFDFKWLPEQYHFWQDWQSFDESDGGICYTVTPITNMLTCQNPVTVPLQYRSRLRLQAPDVTMESEETDYPLDFGYDFRFRIAWTGHCRLKGFRVHAFLEDDETTGTPPT